MDTISELNSILADFNHKKDILDNHTTTLAHELRDWCISESDRITKENEKLRLFVSTNRKLFTDTKFFRRNKYGDVACYEGCCLLIKVYDEDERLELMLGSHYEYARKIGPYTNLPKPQQSVWVYDNEGKCHINRESESVDYWNAVKRELAICNEKLTHLANAVKEFMKTLVINQEARAEETFKNCRDIANGNLVEVSISVRAC